MRFIHVGRSRYVPLSEVLSAEVDGLEVRLTLRSGDVVSAKHDEWAEALSMDFVAAISCPPGLFALELLDDEVHQEPVFGWAINRMGEALPITAQGASVHRRHVLLPDGRVVEHDAWTADVENWRRLHR